MAYDSASEQREVETNFALSSTDYWIGLAYSSGSWAWGNGTVLGPGIVPSNGSPYAHWAQAANTTYAGNTALTAVRAQYSSAYGAYTGDGSVAQQTAAYYTATNKTHGWLPTTPSSAYAYVCRGLEDTQYPCPSSPPPVAQPPEATSISSLCELIHGCGARPGNLLAAGLWLVLERMPLLHSTTVAENYLQHNI